MEDEHYIKTIKRAQNIINKVSTIDVNDSHKLMASVSLALGIIREELEFSLKPPSQRK